jgi:hypothetical protein
VSARREIHALWTRCDGLRAAVERSQDGLDPDSRRQLTACIDELANALRRLENASMLSRAQVHSLESAVSALAAVRANRLPALDTVTAYAATLRETAAALRVRLPEAAADGEAPVPNAVRAAGAGESAAVEPGDGEAAEDASGAADAPGETVLGSASDAVEALAFVTSAAAKAGHHLGGFSRDRTDEDFRLTARCWTCGREVSIGRGGDEWWFVPVTSCEVNSAESGAAGTPEASVIGSPDTGAVGTSVP